MSRRGTLASVTSCAVEFQLGVTQVVHKSSTCVPSYTATAMVLGGRVALADTRGRVGNGEIITRFVSSNTYADTWVNLKTGFSNTLV